MSKQALVITSINRPEASALPIYASGCQARNLTFYIIGDTKSPGDFTLPGCAYWSLEKQLSLNSRLARLLPVSHYARKNLGYIIARQNGAELIIETDDDNYPTENFWNTFKNGEKSKTRCLSGTGWTNIYQFFTEKNVWPRGYPLEELNTTKHIFEDIAEQIVTCPIQQGLADKNPDVDAVYRLTRSLPITFNKDRSIALGPHSWSPFNSQNTLWFKRVAPLMYLPSYCSFRMSDIWRSLIAQRILWINGWSTLFFSPTLYQERNHHDLLADFKDEIPGYLNNNKISKELETLNLKPGRRALADNLITCYDLFITQRWVDPKERELVEAWIEDITT